MNTERTEVSALGEFGLIHHLTKNFETRNASTIVSIGDDAAIIDHFGKQTVISSDLLIEGIHFDLMYTPLRHLGYKSVIVNLSDIYAMKNRLLESYYYLGLYYKNKRDGKNALVQFEMALKLAGKTGMKEKIQTNIDELKGLKNKNGEKQGRKGGLSFRMMD